MPTLEVGQNCDVVLAFHASESLAAGTPASIGFRLTKDQNGRPQYSVVDLAPAELVERVRAQGYEVNEQTLEATFFKDRWDGPFGAYEEGQGRPALTEGIDCKGRHPILAPKRYGMGYKTYTATTISFSTTTPGTILDSANGLAEFKTSDVITITGSASNNGTYNISTGAVAGTIRTTEATAVESAGASITVTVTSTANINDVKVFANSTYVITAGRRVYKVTNWGTPGSSYLVTVFYHSSAVTFNKFWVHNGYLYACAATSGTYAYSTDGTTWVESNRGGTDAQATEMITLRGVLHKRIANNHYQLVASTDTGINGGTAWSSADQIGDTSSNAGKMMVLTDSLVFATTGGLENLDGSGNVSSIIPGLIEIGGGAQITAATTWLNNSIILPMANGSVKIYQQGLAIPATPASQVDRLMDALSQMINPTITLPIVYTAVAGDFVYGHQFDSDDDMRILELEQLEPGKFFWRSFINSRLTTPILSNLWSVYISTGPVLFMDGSQSATRLNYWLLPIGRDALQDSRCRFDSSGVVYDPWITFGCPEVTKRWSYIEVAVTESTPANFAKDTYTLDGINEAGTDKITTNSLTLVSGITIGNINFDSNTTSRRMRLVHTLGNTGTNQELETPILLWIRVHAYLNPDPKWVWKFTVDLLRAAIDDGTYTQREGRLFITAMRSNKLPMTLITPFKDGPNADGSWTVNTLRSRPAEALTNISSWGQDEVAEIVLVQQVTGS